MNENEKRVVERIIRRAGALLKRRFGTALTWKNKTVKGDVESEADRQSERLIVQGLKRAFPEDAVLTEEHPDVVPGSNGRLWVVDSLDGSRNFVLGVPLFGISIALLERWQPTFGMIFLPVENKLYWASKGTGAFCETKRIRVSKARGMQNTMIAVAVVYQTRSSQRRVKRLDEQLRRSKAWDINLGNMVIPLCYTAKGTYDGIVYFGASVWDIAAGALLVAEAGGRVTDCQGKPLQWNHQLHDIVAGPRLVHKQILQIL